MWIPPRRKRSDTTHYFSLFPIVFEVHNKFSAKISSAPVMPLKVTEVLLSFFPGLESKLIITHSLFISVLLLQHLKWSRHFFLLYYRTVAFLLPVNLHWLWNSLLVLLLGNLVLFRLYAAAAADLITSWKLFFGSRTLEGMPSTLSRRLVNSVNSGQSALPCLSKLWR